MKATCPDCGTQGHVTAFFADEEGKRLAAALAGLSPELGRATLAYLGLFKPAKTALRLARATKLVQELTVLVAAGSVCKDERGNARRPCNQYTWAAGIEQMLQQRASLSLPLDNHHYLRAVVYGLADKADAAAERQRESDARAGRHHGPNASSAQPVESKLENELRWIEQQVGYGLDEAEADRLRAEARAKYGGEPA